MKLVLVLEDDRRVLDLLCLILRSKGYVVLPARTAEEALRQAAQHDAAIELLIADIVLTASTGIRVAVQLKQRLPHLRIVLVSGYPAHTWTSRYCAELEELPPDAVTVLQKPFRPDTLVELVGKLIGSPAQKSGNRGTA